MKKLIACALVVIMMAGVATSNLASTRKIDPPYQIN